MLSNDVPEIAKWAGVIFGFIGAGLSGIVTFFNFNKAFEGHRRLANRYLSLGRECDRLRAVYDDGQKSLSEIANELKELNRICEGINSDAENYPTSSTSFGVSLEKEKLRQEGISKRYGRAVVLDDDENISNADRLDRTSKKGT